MTCRGLALLGEVRHPVFPEVMAATVASHQKRTLEPRLMRQVFQAIAAARILGAELSTPEDLEQTAYKWSVFSLLAPGSHALARLWGSQKLLRHNGSFTECTLA